MYNINLKDCETIIYNNDDVNVLNNEKIINVSLVITNKRLIILEDVNKLDNMNTVLRTTKAIGFIPQKEIIFETNLENINSIIPGKTIKINLKNNTFIELDDKEIVYILENMK